MLTIEKKKSDCCRGQETSFSSLEVQAVVTSKAVWDSCKAYLFTSSLKKINLRRLCSQAEWSAVYSSSFFINFWKLFCCNKLLYALYLIFSITAVFQTGQVKKGSGKSSHQPFQGSNCGHDRRSSSRYHCWWYRLWKSQLRYRVKKITCRTHSPTASCHVWAILHVSQIDLIHD